MTDAKRDNNSVVTLIGVSSADGITPVLIWVDPITHRLLVNSSGGSTPGGSNTQVQYNNAGTLGGITGATTDGTKLTLVAPVLGAALATSINGLVITTTTGTLTIAAAKVVTINNTLTFSGTDTASIAFGGGGTVAYTGNKLSVFAATTSAELLGVISDETGSGLLVFNNAPTFIAPVLGAATATSINGLTISTTTGIFTLTNGKTFSVQNTITLAGTDSSTYTFPNATDTIMGLGTAQTITGVKTYNSGKLLATAPQFTTSINDANGNIIIALTPIGSAVNYVKVTNAITGTAGPIISPDGETNIDLKIAAKGTGKVHHTSGTYGDLTAYSPAGAGTATLTLNTSNIHRITMPAGNITIALSNEAVGQCFVIDIIQDSTGSRTVTWFTTIKWAGGVAPTLTTTANKIDTFGFIVTSAGNYQGYIVGQNV